MNFILYRRRLPGGWYPETGEEVKAFISACSQKKAGAGALPDTEAGGAIIAVVPHAGWFFSGELAWRGISSLAPAETVVVLGGHLPPGGSLMVYACDAFETPLGDLQSDKDFLERLAARLPCEKDRARDNTVEVQLPLVKYAFPRAKVAALRAPPSELSFRLGRFLAELYREKGSGSMAIVASTDLTHYGPAYGFTPRGTGPSAEAWARDENDMPFLEALAARDYDTVLRRGLEGNAACSSGAAAAAAVCAGELGLKGRVAGYATSGEKQRSASFVGYGVVLFI